MYRYAGNNPVNGNDPSGLEWVWPWDPNASWNPIDTAHMIGGSVGSAVTTGISGVQAGIPAPLPIAFPVGPLPPMPPVNWQVLTNLACNIANLGNNKLIKDIVDCGCFGAAILDIFPGPGWLDVVERVDCACNLLTTAQLACKNSWPQFFAYGIATYADCRSVPIGTFIGGLLGFDVGAAGGGTAGTVVEPGGGTAVGAVGGTVFGVPIGIAVGDAFVDIAMFTKI